MKAENIAKGAAVLVSGDRAVTHGDKHANFTAIARLWNAYLRSRFDNGKASFALEAHEIADMMELLKIARRINGAFNIDDYIDGAGYAAIAGELKSGNL